MAPRRPKSRSRDAPQAAPRAPAKAPSPTTAATAAAACGAPGAVSSGGVRKPARPLSALQQKLARRLAGGDFRQLNERLYTTTGAAAAAMLARDPALFAAYHAGYADQVRRWPSNPLDRVLAFLRAQPPALVVADLGCGEARLARDAPQTTVHSFDLVAASDAVVACDIAHTPLPDGAVDVVVFCLALMGTNYGEFLAEARRIVKNGGWVLVTEVASRFQGDDVKAFTRAVEALGFTSSNTHDFVRDDTLEANVGEHNIGHGGKRKRSASGVGKGKKGRKKPASQVVDGRKGSAAVSDAPFFIRFAFQARKKRPEQIPRMPSLKACVYKKR